VKRSNSLSSAPLTDSTVPGSRDLARDGGANLGKVPEGFRLRVSKPSAVLDSFLSLAQAFGLGGCGLQLGGQLDLQLAPLGGGYLTVSVTPASSERVSGSLFGAFGLLADRANDTRTYSGTRERESWRLRESRRT
jgi:hypothetical protein